MKILFWVRPNKDLIVNKDKVNSRVINLNINKSVLFNFTQEVVSSLIN